MNEKYALRAGLFIIFSILLGLGVLVSIAGTKSLFQKFSTYTVVFEPGDNVSGLATDSEVRVYGVKLGQVTKIQVVPDEQRGALVMVEFQVPDTFTLREDVQVFSEASLTGLAWLNIESFGEGAELAGGDTIPGQTGGLASMLPAIREMIPKASATMEKFGQTSDEFKGLASDVRLQVPNIVKRYDDLTDAGKDALSEIKAVMVRAQKSVEKLDPTLDHIEALAGDLRSLIAQNRAKIDRTMTALRRASENLEGGVADIRAAPWRLLYKPDKKDQKNLEVYAAAREFADAAEDLEAAAASFRDTMDDPSADPEKIDQMRDDLIQKFEHFDRIQGEIWSQFEL